MIEDLFFLEKQAYRDSFLHRLDTRVKILVSFAVIIAIVAVPYSPVVYHSCRYPLSLLPRPLGHLSYLACRIRKAAPRHRSPVGHHHPLPDLPQEPVLYRVPCRRTPAPGGEHLRRVDPVRLHPGGQVPGKHLLHHPALGDDQNPGPAAGREPARPPRRVCPCPCHDDPVPLCLRLHLPEGERGTRDPVLPSP